jgi:hypothetical protein
MDGVIKIPTLYDRIVTIQQSSSLTATRQRDLVSGVVCMCKVTGVDPRITPASLQVMRPRINAVRPAKHNLTPKAWSNVRSNFRAALGPVRK